MASLAGRIPGIDRFASGIKSNFVVISHISDTGAGCFMELSGIGVSDICIAGITSGIGTV